MFWVKSLGLQAANCNLCSYCHSACVSILTNDGEGIINLATYRPSVTETIASLAVISNHPATSHLGNHPCFASRTLHTIINSNF